MEEGVYGGCLLCPLYPLLTLSNTSLWPLNSEVHVIHIEKFTSSTIQIFFFFRYIFCVAIASEKHE